MKFNNEEIVAVLAEKGSLKDAVDLEILKQFVFKYQPSLYGYKDINEAVDDMLRLLADIEDPLFLGTDSIKH